VQRLPYVGARGQLFNAINTGDADMVSYIVKRHPQAHGWIDKNWSIKGFPHTALDHVLVTEKFALADIMLAAQPALIAQAHARGSRLNLHRHAHAPARVDYLLGKGVPMDKNLDAEGVSILAPAARSGDLPFLDRLITAGVPMDTSQTDGAKPLFGALLGYMIYEMEVEQRGGRTSNDVHYLLNAAAHFLRCGANINTQDPTMQKIADIAKNTAHATFLETLAEVRQDHIRQMRDTLGKGLGEAQSGQMIEVPKLKIGPRKP
jgi:hypothetical protein